MAFSTQSEEGDVMSEINVTPLVDVMLVLLVVFMVTTPIMNNAIKVNLPKTQQTTPPKQKEAINLTINDQGQVFIDKQPIALKDVENELKARQFNNPNLALHLRADDAARYGAVAKVMASIERAGITNLAVITEQQN